MPKQLSFDFPKSLKEVAQLGGGKLAELEEFLGLDGEGEEYADRVAAAWADLKNRSEDKEKPKVTTKKKKPSTLRKIRERMEEEEKVKEEPKEEKKPAVKIKEEEPEEEDEEEDHPYRKLALRITRAKPEALAPILQELADSTDHWPGEAVLDLLSKVPVKARGGKGAGITSAIVRHLRAASEDNPLTKDELWEKLCADFPDHSKSSLMATASKIPWTLINQNGLTVHGAEIEGTRKKGYWMDPENGKQEEVEDEDEE